MRRLILRPGAIGDCIVSLPALEHLVTDYTEVWISSAVVPLIRFADEVKSLAASGIELFGVGDLPALENLITKLRSFDHIVSWYGSNRPEFKAAIRALSIPCDFHAALPPPDYRCYAGEFFADQVGAKPKLTPRIPIAPTSQRSAVVIQPFSGSARKSWPLSSFEELARSLTVPVEWCIGPEEQFPDASKIDNLATLAKWISGSCLYIGNDSGITHLAAAVGVPVLALFGPTSPTVWAPRGENVTVLHRDPLARLSFETVLESANRLLGLQ